MSEMSLVEQIRAITDMIDYIEKTFPDDIELINNDAESAVRYFYQNGRTDLAAKVEAKRSKMEEKLNDLRDKLFHEDLDYLYRVKDNLVRVYNNN